MKIMIVDGQGGGIGRSLIEQIRSQLPDLKLLAIGTNANATSAMVKAGADLGATGENAVVWNASKATVIIGPVGIFFANSLAGEISPKMAEALASSSAEKIAIGVSKCHIHLVGIKDQTLGEQIEQVISLLKEWVNLGLL